LILQDSNHGDVGGGGKILNQKQKAALSWMIDQAKNAGVQMRGMRKSYYVK